MPNIAGPNCFYSRKRKIFFTKMKVGINCNKGSLFEIKSLLESFQIFEFYHLTQTKTHMSYKQQLTYDRSKVYPENSECDLELRTCYMKSKS